MKTKTVSLFVLRQSESGKAIECTLPDRKCEPFWLPKKSLTPQQKPVRRNATSAFVMPEWLWLSHRQLCGDEAYEAEKARREAYKRELVP